MRQSQWHDPRLNVQTQKTLLGDSFGVGGSMDYYRPAQHKKPQSFIISVVQKLFNLRNRGPGEMVATTEQGSSAVSPSIYQFQRYDQIYQRQSIIADANAMIREDPRAKRSVDKFAREAVRGGCVITLNQELLRTEVQSPEITEENAAKLQQINLEGGSDALEAPDQAGLGVNNTGGGAVNMANVPNSNSIDPQYVQGSETIEMIPSEAQLLLSPEPVGQNQSVLPPLPPEMIQRLEQAQVILSGIQSIVNTKVESWARMLIVEGDLFLQLVISEDEKTGISQIVDVQRMPAAAMERNVDDMDNFINPMEAFSQVDIMTRETVTTFPAALMQHFRWNHIDGELYGESELIASRRLRRLLEVIEEGQVIRRMTRAAPTRLWNIGTSENPGNIDDIKEFKQNNGFVDGVRDIYDPNEIPKDFFGDGLIEVQTVSTEGEIGEIQDIQYFSNLYTAAGLPTPSPIYGFDAYQINRDIMQDIRTEWLKETQVLTNQMEKAVRWICDTALLLNGYLPEATPYKIAFSVSTVELPFEAQQRVIEAYQAGLLSQKTALQNIAEYYNINDIDQELEAIQTDHDRQDQRALNVEMQKNFILAQRGGLIAASTKGSTAPSSEAQFKSGGGGDDGGDDSGGDDSKVAAPPPKSSGKETVPNGGIQVGGVSTVSRELEGRI